MSGNPQASSPLDPGLRAVMKELRGQVEDFERRSITAIRAGIASYERVTDEDLEASVRINCRTAIETLERLAIPSPAVTEVTREQIRRRVAAGLDINDLIRAYRINLDVVHSRYAATCVDHGISLASALAGTTLLWRLGDVFAVASVTSFREQTEQNAVRRSHEQRDLIRDGLRVGFTFPEDLRRAAAAGLNPTVHYAVVIARSTSPGSYDLQRELTRDGSTADAGAVTTQISGRVIGLVSRPPQACAEHAVMALGKFVALSALPESLRVAEDIWRVVSGSDVPGLTDLRTLSWRMAIGSNAEVGRYLVEGLITPLRTDTDAGQELLHTLRVYLEQDRSVRETAAALFVHENTVRYRLSRFEELTGRSLRHTGTLVELAWALETERLDQGEAGYVVVPDL